MNSEFFHLIGKVYHQKLGILSLNWSNPDALSPKNLGRGSRHVPPDSQPFWLICVEVLHEKNWDGGLTRLRSAPLAQPP
ncbi:hypothetical protein DP117_18090 [Brasilonema sp. UFV-L1]|nr:hypothetical protein [Brasilonema sp. UFV-L1]